MYNELSAKEKYELKLELFDIYKDLYRIPVTNRGLDEMLDVWENEKLTLLDYLSSHSNWNRKRLRVETEIPYPYDTSATDYTNGLSGTIHALFTSASPFGYIAIHPENLDKNANPNILALLSIMSDINWDKIVDISTGRLKEIERLRMDCSSASTFALVLPILKNLEKDRIYRHNMKLTKFVKKVLKETLKDEIFTRCEQDINLYMSNKLTPPTQKKVRLCISLHPTDYATMSVGNSWNSCYYPNHEYDMGTFEYMQNPNTAIAYMEKCDEDSHQKLHRCVVHFNRNCIDFGPVYPNRDNPEPMLKKLLNCLYSSEYPNDADIDLTELSDDDEREFFLGYDDFYYNGYYCRSESRIELAFPWTTRQCPAKNGICMPNGTFVNESCDDHTTNNYTVSSDWYNSERDIEIKMPTCDICGKEATGTEYLVDSSAGVFCPDCYNEKVKSCKLCHADFILKDDSDEMCPACQSMYRTCSECNILVGNWINVGDKHICKDCYLKQIKSSENMNERQNFLNHLSNDFLTSMHE